MIVKTGGLTLEVSAEEAKILKTGLVALSWDDFPLAEEMSDALQDQDVYGYDIDGEVTKTRE